MWAPARPRCFRFRSCRPRAAFFGPSTDFFRFLALFTKRVSQTRFWPKIGYCCTLPPFNAAFGRFSSSLQSPQSAANQLLPSAAPALKAAPTAPPPTPPTRIIKNAFGARNSRKRPPRDEPGLQAPRHVSVSTNRARDLDLSSGGYLEKQAHVRAVPGPPGALGLHRRDWYYCADGGVAVADAGGHRRQAVDVGRRLLRRGRGRQPAARGRAPPERPQALPAARAARVDVALRFLFRIGLPPGI